MTKVIAVVDANDRHRHMVAEVLGNFYTVESYADDTNAIWKMHLTQPSLIIVGQNTVGRSGVNFITDLRKEEGTGCVPTLLIVDSEDFRTFDAIHGAGITDFLVKPYQKSALIAVVARQINSKVEKSWLALPPAQHKALENTLCTLNGVARNIANGENIGFDSISDLCGPIVSAVKSGQTHKIIHAVKNHDNYTYVHSLRVSILLTLFGQAIGLSTDLQMVLATGGLLHDAGKMAIPRATLNKIEKLTAEDWQLMRGHVEKTQVMLGAIEHLPKGVMAIAVEHHERLDGSGYPKGLESAGLNQLSRMAGIIDVFTALTDERPYRRALGAEVALEMMVNNMDGLLDRRLILKFREILVESAGFSGGDDDGEGVKTKISEQA